MHIFLAHAGHDHSQMAEKSTDSATTFILIVSALIVVAVVGVVMVVAKRNRYNPTAKAVDKT